MIQIASRRELLDRRVIGDGGVDGMSLFDQRREERESIFEFLIGEIVGENSIRQLPNGVDDTRRTNTKDNIWNSVISCNVACYCGKSKEAGFSQGRLGSKTYRVGVDRTSVVMHLDDVMNGVLHFILEVENCRERINENVKHGLFDHVMSNLSRRSDNKTIRSNHIRRQSLG